MIGKIKLGVEPGCSAIRRVERPSAFDAITVMEKVRPAKLATKSRENFEKVGRRSKMHSSYDAVNCVLPTPRLKANLGV